MYCSPPRSIKLIKEDLAVIDESINHYNQYIEMYPSDKALKFSLESVINRRSILLDELKEAFKLKNKSLFDLKLLKSGTSPIQSNSNEIPAAALGGVLTTYQEFLTSIVHRMHSNKESTTGRIPKHITQLSTINVAATSTGSFRVIFSDSLNILSYSDQPTPTIDALKMINKILDSSNDLDKLKKLREELGTRVFSKYKNFIEHIVKNQLEISFYDELGCEIFEKKVINKEFSSRTYSILTNLEESPISYEILLGKLDTLGQRERRFKFYLDNGTVISGKFIKNLSSQLSRWDFNQRVCCKFKHQKFYNEAQDREIDNWTLIQVIRKFN